MDKLLNAGQGRTCSGQQSGQGPQLGEDRGGHTPLGGVPLSSLSAPPEGPAHPPQKGGGRGKRQRRWKGIAALRRLAETMPTEPHEF